MDYQEKNPVGTLRISREVIATIAKTAAIETNGVAGLAAASVDWKGMFARRQLPRSISVLLNDDIAEIELHLILKAESRIPTVSEQVQRTVKEAVQSMTGITVSRVNVCIEGVAYPAPAAEA